MTDDHPITSPTELTPGDVIRVYGEEYELTADLGAAFRLKDHNSVVSYGLIEEALADGEFETVELTETIEVDREVIADATEAFRDVEEALTELQTLQPRLGYDEVRDLLWRRSSATQTQSEAVLDLVLDPPSDGEEIIRDLLYVNTDLNKRECEEVVDEINALAEKYPPTDHDE